MTAKTRRSARHVHTKAGSMRGWYAICRAAKRRSAIRNVASRKHNRDLERVAGRDVKWTQKQLKSS